MDRINKIYRIEGGGEFLHGGLQRTGRGGSFLTELRKADGINGIFLGKRDQITKFSRLPNYERKGPMGRMGLGRREERQISQGAID